MGTYFDNCDTRIIVSSGGVPITVTGENVDSVAEPIMVVTVITNAELSVYYQVAHLKYSFTLNRVYRPEPDSDRSANFVHIC